tara:strand:+ start:456 stop:899 length:444 start_codon:yes stop_codon:yes gene_type:complete
LVKIELHKEPSVSFKPNNTSFQHIVKELMLEEGVDEALLSVIITNDSKLNDLKRKYFGENVFTDVIAFNYNDHNQNLEGDIFISIDRVKENSLKYSDSFESELMRVLIHGSLHLLGYEDSDLNKKKIMISKENYYLKLFEKFKLCND